MGAVGSPCRVARLGPTAQAPPSLATLQGLPPAPITRAPSPQGVGSQKVGANNKCPIYYSPLQSPLLLGSTKAGAMADGAAIAPASPPPTPKGVDFYRAANNKCPAVYSPLQIPPLPHPYKGIGGSPLFRFMAHCRGLPPAPITRAPSPQGGGLPNIITAAIEPGQGRVPRQSRPPCPGTMAALR